MADICDPLPSLIARKRTYDEALVLGECNVAAQFSLADECGYASKRSNSLGEVLGNYLDEADTS